MVHLFPLINILLDFKPESKVQTPIEWEYEKVRERETETAKVITINRKLEANFIDQQSRTEKYHSITVNYVQMSSWAAHALKTEI